MPLLESAQFCCSQGREVVRSRMKLGYPRTRLPNSALQQLWPSRVAKPPADPVARCRWLCLQLLLRYASDKEHRVVLLSV